MAERTIHFQLKAVDDQAGTFEGYGSVFHTVDSYKDRVMPGAFKRTLGERGAGAVKLLWQHDRTQPIGVYEEIAEDERGLHVRGRLLVNEVQKAREAYALMKAGALDGLSIGYKPLKFTKNEKLGTTDLLDVDLYEISPVTFPANGDARITGVKGNDMTDKQEVELVEKAKLDEAKAKVADLEQQVQKAGPVLAAVAKLTGKDDPTDQIVELASLQGRLASLPSAEQLRAQERAQLVSELQRKQVPPTAIQALEAACDAAGGDLAVLRAGAAKLEAPKVHVPAAQERNAAAPQASGEVVLTEQIKAEYRRCGINDEALMLAAEKSRRAPAAPSTESDEE